MTTDQKYCFRPSGRHGFSLIELLLSSALLVLLLAFMIPCWTQWQVFARQQLATSVAQWDRDFLAHRFYFQAMQASQVQIVGTELKLTGTNATLRYGVSNQQLYESNQSKRYLTYAPVAIKNFALATQGSLVHVSWDTSLGASVERGEAYVP